MLPVTGISRLIRDPYAIYARYILRLFPLDPLRPEIRALAAPMLAEAAGLTLLSFSSTMLAARGFAEKNRYDIDADREIAALGAANVTRVPLGVDLDLFSPRRRSIPTTGTASSTARA